MTPWHIRDITAEDLEAVVQLDDASTTTQQRPAFALADVVAAIADRNPAVLAIADGAVVGSAAFTNSGCHARVGLTHFEKVETVSPGGRGTRPARRRGAAGGAVGPEGGLASGLYVTFGDLAELDNTVVFIDEVEEIAAARNGGSVATGVVNELLKDHVACHAMWGRTLDTGSRCHPSDADYRAVITGMRRTLTGPMVVEFHAHIDAFART